MRQLVRMSNANYDNVFKLIEFSRHFTGHAPVVKVMNDIRYDVCNRTGCFDKVPDLCMAARAGHAAPSDL